MVGWYMEFSFKVMEGALAVEWYWKEHTDLRVFQYVDFAAQLTLFAIGLEVGFGVKRAWFKAQIYLLFEGEVSVSRSARRAHPDCVEVLRIGYGASIKGSLGVRAEAGNYLRADAHGESAIEVKGDLAVNRSPQEKIGVDGAVAWTGLKCSVMISVGPDSCAGELSYEGELMKPMELTTFHWPGDKYEPPRMSRDAMAGILEDVITEGTDVRVYGQDSWGVGKIAGALANRMDKHAQFQRTKKTVEGLAHAIRADLDALLLQHGERHWLMQNIPEPIFLAYVQGPKLQGHLDRAINPAQSYITAA